MSRRRQTDVNQLTKVYCIDTPIAWNAWKLLWRKKSVNQLSCGPRELDLYMNMSSFL